MISLLTALFTAIPALEKLVRDAMAALDAARAADAAARKQQKDTAVDQAIDNPPSA